MRAQVQGIEVDFSSDTPVYQQIAGGVRALVARGELADGAELPSVRDLAARVGVNLNTVARAYRTLADEGLLDLRHGSRARVKSHRVLDVQPTDGLERQVHDVASRLVLQGAGPEEVKRFFATALARFFQVSTEKE
jgi:DNA-binding transcriptional regulator YhcF (GntR family)